MKPSKDVMRPTPGRSISRTPGWILVRIPSVKDGKHLDSQEALDLIAHHPWARDSRYIGVARSFHLFEYPGPGTVAPRGNTGRVPARQETGR